MSKEKTKTKRRLVASVMLAAAVWLGSSFGVLASAEENLPSWKTGFEIGKTPINSVLDVGAGTAEYLGSTYNLSATVVYPDGRKTTNSKFIADVPGTYEVKYAFTAGEESFEKTESFTVYRNSASLFTASSDCVIDENGASPSYMTKSYTGISVNPKSAGAKLTYNNPIDLSDNDASEALFEFIYTPKKAGTTEIEYIYLTFTDAFNPDNYMKWMIYSGSVISWPQFTLVSVWGSNQSRYMETSSTSIRVTPAGYSPVYSDEESYLPVALYYDSESKAATGWPHKWGNLDRDNQESFNDLDDSKFAECAEPWGGFSSGLAYLDIEFGSITSSDASILLLSLDGQDLTSPEIDETDEKIAIGIDYDGYSADEIPCGVKGIAYPVFDAIAASSLSGKTAVNGVNVVDPDGNLVAIENGKFTPTEAGDYNIVYTATSPSGKTAIKTVTVKVNDGYANEIAYAFNSRLADETNVFDPYYLYAGAASGGEGKIVSTIKVLDSDNNEATTLSDGGTDYFVPQSTGTYKLVATVTDFLGTTETFEKEITVVATKTVEFTEIALPKAIRKEMEFEFPAVTAKTYTASGIERAAATLKINGVSNETRKFTPTTTDDITATYAIGETSVDYTVKVLDITQEAGFMAKYFYSDDGTFSFEGEGSVEEITFTAASDGAEWSFVNAINTSDLGLKFGITSGVTRVDFLLVDAVNPINKLAFGVEKEGGKYYFLYNGEKVKEITSPETADFGFTVNKNTLAVTDADGKTLCVASKRADGEPFGGFDGDAVYLNATVSGEENAVMTISKISRQTISNAVRDLAAPILVMPDEAATRTVLLGEEGSFGTAYGFDVFDLYATATTVKIVAPGGTTLYEGAIDTAYVFTASKLGDYRATYKTVDLSGNEMSFNRTIKVVEKDAPTVTLTGKYSTSCNAGDTVALATANVTDASKTSVYYVITNANGYYRVSSEASWKFKEAGVYVVKVAARDAYSNEGFATYVVTVK